MKSLMLSPELSTMLGVSGIVFLLAFMVSFVLFVLILYVIIKAIKNNSQSAQLTVQATVIGKRTRYYLREGFPGNEIYYVSFEIKGGDRVELNTTARDYGILFEGDRGLLTFRGSYFLEFQRKAED